MEKQPPDYYVQGKKYWFFRYFKGCPDVDIIDIKSCNWLESFEKNIIRFYIWQSLRAIPRLGNYDLIVSHGMQSSVVISLWRKFFKTKAKHIVFDIGSFNSAAESGFALKLMQFASKSIDGIIYHTSSQRDYYENFFPWIVDKSYFMRFGADADYFSGKCVDGNTDADKRKIIDKQYCICVGYSKRDWDTVIKAFCLARPVNLTLKLIGHVDLEYQNIPGVEQIGYISIKELIKEISGAKFGILPLKSFNYSYGQMTLMQQMALGKCVITSRVPSLVDYVVDGETAIFYEAENEIQLADKIKIVNEDDVLRRSIEKKAREFISKECNEKVMAVEIEKVINEVFRG